MNILYILLCIAYADCFYTNVTIPLKERIEGGRPAEVREVPHQACIEHEDGIGCATILSPDWLITNQHIFVNRQKENFTVRTGTIWTTQGGVTRVIEEILPKSGYNPLTQDHDVALVKVNLSFELNENVNAIPIAHPDDHPQNDDIVTISGYGREFYNSATLSPGLKIAQSRVISLQECNTAYIGHSPVTNNMFCTASTPNAPCVGDSGGPVTFQGKLIGIITGNLFCRPEDYPSNHMEVARYYGWIVEKTGLNL